MAVPIRNSCTDTVISSPPSFSKIGASASKLRLSGTAGSTGCGVAAGVSTASGSTGADASGIAAAGCASGRAANGAANAKRPSTTARRNVFLKGQTLLAICGARLYNRDIPRGLSQYTRGPPLL